MIIRSKEEYPLERIVEESDRVLVDTSCIGNDYNGLCSEIYDCQYKLDLDADLLITQASSTSSFLVEVHKNPHIITVPGVVNELNHFVDILNSQVNFHKQNIDSRKFKGKSLRDKRSPRLKSNRYDCEEVDSHEVQTLALLTDYANVNFMLARELGSRVVNPIDMDLFKSVVNRSNHRGLKKDFSQRYDKPRKKNNPNNVTDEELVTVAYELASQGNNIALCSEDSDMHALLSSCFHNASSIFRVPKKGRLALYSRFEKENYDLRFDSTFLLCSSKEGLSQYFSRS